MEEIIRIMKSAVSPIISYLEEQKDIYDDALRAYDPVTLEDPDPELRRMREIEAIKLRTLSSEMRRHIAVIKLMSPK